MAADRLGTSRQRVQRIANELAYEGLAAFDENPATNGPRFLPLIRDGRTKLDAITKRSRTQHRALLNDLSDVDVRHPTSRSP
jgi:DNA-binding MarR family transcriptional regulator